MTIVILEIVREKNYTHTHTHTHDLFFGLFRAIPEAYGGSQARGLISAIAAGLRQSHSNDRSEPHLRPAP